MKSDDLDLPIKVIPAQGPAVDALAQRKEVGTLEDVEAEINSRERPQRTPEQEEIAKAWETLEGFGFPPEAVGWPFRSVVGLLPEAIECALDCLVRQREDLLKEVLELRKLKSKS